jgi:ABC-type multidrug transport system fused ATPase/permease subunit
MDQIIVLETGRVVEEGSFGELLDLDGPFAAMARKQGITS